MKGNCSDFEEQSRKRSYKRDNRDWSVLRIETAMQQLLMNAHEIRAACQPIQQRKPVREDAGGESAE